MPVLLQMPPLRIANTCAFWGDDVDASARTTAQDHSIDYLTLDYLAEVSMSILAKLKQRDPSAGYAGDFLHVIASLIPAWKSGGKFKVITNAGGLNPAACARACAAILRDAGLTTMKVGVVGGDDVLPIIRQSVTDDPASSRFCHLETGASIAERINEIVTANAYLGAFPILDAIDRGADIVVTGRVADPSLVVGPFLAHFRDLALDSLAGATVAGHLIECGTQVTGGISTDWMNLPICGIGFPIVEVSPDGSCIVTKPNGSGGAVNEWTVKEQLLYELGDPGNYLSPDVSASFLTLKVQDLGNNRVRVSGATGQPAPATLKVSATLRAGYRACGMLTIIGREAFAKAHRAAEVVRAKLGDPPPREFHVEALGSNDSLAGVLPAKSDLMETVLRITVADDRKEIVERFTRQMVSLVTAGPQGTTGYFEGRPAVREVFEYWPCLIDRSLVKPSVEIVT